jgi:hypothetical protein
MANTNTNFTPEQLGANADHALEAIHQAGALAPDLVAQWLQSSNAPALQAVAELGQGPARKAARRGLNVLKARGIRVPAAPRMGRLQASTDKIREAWLLPPDGSGTEGVVLAERQPSGSYQACFVFFRENQNILRVQNGTVGISRIKEIMQQSLGGAGYGPVSIPWAWAQARVLERRAWHQSRSFPEPLGLMGAEKLLAGAPTGVLPHPFDEEGLALGDEDAEKLARDSGVLHQWPEFRSWLPAERAVQELLVSVGRKLGPTPPTSQAEIDPIVKAQVAAATDRYFTPERRAVLANRMKDSGLSVLNRLGEHAALQVSAVIHVIQGAGLITNPPSDVKFLTSFFDKAIALLAAQQGGQLRVPVPRAAAPTEVSEAVDPSDAVAAVDGDDPLGAEPAPVDAQAEPAATESAPTPS